MKKKLLFISFVSHNIYKGWLYFFDKYFIFSTFDNNLFNYNLNIERYFIGKFKMYNFPTNLLVFNKDPIVAKNKYDYIIIGDIFVLLLSFKYLFYKNVSFYSEFFIKAKDSKIKIILFYIWTLFFRNRKFIVPTKLANNTFLKISKKVLYFPPIYYGDIYENKTLNDNKLKIIFVGRLGYKMKNLTYLLSELLKLDFDFEIKLCGDLKGFEKDYEYFKEKLGSKLIYSGYLNEKELSNEYLKSNLFILPSISEPIGSVLFEAMGHSLPIIVSNNSGSSDYIKNGYNGFIYDNNIEGDLLKKIIYFNDSKNRLLFGNNSYKIIHDEFYYKNNTFLDNKYKELITFLDN